MKIHNALYTTLKFRGQNIKERQLKITIELEGSATLGK